MLADRYGGKRGFAAHLRATLASAFASPAPDWSRVERVVFVCKGNICRSAYAEARARLAGLTAASAGLEADDGGPADPLAARHAAARGVDLSAHRTMPVSKLTLGSGDLILCMEPAQAAAIRALGTSAQVDLLGRFARPRRPYLHDPYGLGAGYWQTALDVIDSAVARVAARLAGARV